MMCRAQLARSVCLGRAMGKAFEPDLRGMATGGNSACAVSECHDHGRVRVQLEVCATSPTTAGRCECE